MNNKSVSQKGWQETPLKKTSYLDWLKPMLHGTDNKHNNIIKKYLAWHRKERETIPIIEGFMNWLPQKNQISTRTAFSLSDQSQWLIPKDKYLLFDKKWWGSFFSVSDFPGHRRLLIAYCYWCYGCHPQRLPLLHSRLSRLHFEFGGVDVE